MQPELIDLGFITIRYYGLMYAIGLYLALIIFASEFKRLKIKLDANRISNCVFGIFFAGLIGGRLYYVLFNLDWYLSDRVPWYEFLAIWKGGLAIHGGILGGLIGVLVMAKIYRLQFFQLADATCLSCILGQAIGRIGNFMNGDAHGTPTDVPWGLVFPHGPASREFPGIAIHPVMIYESLLNLGAFLILWRLRLKGFKAGFISFLFIIFYSVIRSVVTFFRADDLYLWVRYQNGIAEWFTSAGANFAWGIRAPHAISLAGIAISLIFILTFRLYQKTETKNR